MDSTNAVLAGEHGNLPDFTVLVAAEQTAGQGRAGRSWISESGSSLSVSVLLRPKELSRANLITLLAAASLHQALSHIYQSTISIKWPNDILIGNLKVAGILAQLNADQSVVCGVGVNLFQQAAAPETSVSLSSVGEVDFDEVCAAYLSALNQNWQLFQKDEIDWLLPYVRANCSTLGSEVRADLVNGESIVGTATGITDDGRLVIHNETEHLVSAADVWHLRKQ